MFDALISLISDTSFIQKSFIIYNSSYTIHHVVSIREIRATISFIQIHVPSDLLRDSMFDLQSSIDLNEVEISGLVGQKFDGTSVRISNMFCQSYSVLRHFISNFGI